MSSASRYIIDKVTAELFDAGNYRQALKNTEKKLKKAPNNVHYLTLKALLLCETQQFADGKAICSRLIAQKPAVTASDEVAFLFLTICRLDRHDYRVRPQEVEALWKNAIAQRQNNADKQIIAKHWADLSVSEGHWHSLAKAAVQLQKSVEANTRDFRKYVFWGAVGSYIGSMQLGTERERQISKNLSLRKLQLNANLSSDSPDSMLALANWIATPEEHLLTQELVSSSSDASSNIKIFLSPAMNLENDKVVSGAWLERLQFCEKILLEEGDFNDAYSLSRDVLHKAQQHKVDFLSDDWHNLRVLRDSALKSQDSGNLQDLIDELKSNFHLGPAMSRGIHEAYLSLTYALENKMNLHQQNGIRTETKHFLAFKEYFKTYATYAWGIDSLLTQFFALDARERVEARNFMTEHVKIVLKSGQEDNEISQLKWITAECKLLHLDMEVIKRALKATANGPISDAAEERLVDHIVQCIRLYKISRCHTAQLVKTEVDPGNRACLLAVDGLLELSRRTYKQLYSIQAVLLLEFARRDSTDSDIKIKEIVILKKLGLSSLGLTIYKELGIKQVLCDSMCPVYFTRSGTCLPSADPRKELYSVFEKSLKFYGTAMSKISNHQQLALSHRNYQSAVDMEVFRQSLVNSLTRRMLIYERRRVERILGIVFEGVTQDEYKVSANTKYVEPLNCKAPRARGVFFDGESLVTDEYVYWLTAVDEVHDVIRAKELRVSAFSSFCNFDHSQALTMSEKDHYSFASTAVDILGQILFKGADANFTILPGMVEEVLSWMTKSWEKFKKNPLLESNVESAPFVELVDLQQVFLLAESFQTAWFLAAKITAFMKSQTAIKKEDSKKISAIVKQTQDSAIQKLKELKQNAALRKSRLDDVTSNTSTVSELSRFWNDDKGSKTGDALMELIGERWMQQDFLRFVESSRSTMDAIIALRLPSA